MRIRVDGDWGKGRDTLMRDAHARPRGIRRYRADFRALQHAASIGRADAMLIAYASLWPAPTAWRYRRARGRVFSATRSRKDILFSAKPASVATTFCRMVLNFSTS